MKKTIRIGKKLLPILVLGLAVGFLLSFGCGDDDVAANRAPVLSEIGNKTVDEADNLSFTVTASDPDGDTLSFSATDLPSGASFSEETQEVSWTPSYGQEDTYDVTFTVSDGGLSDSETITITVNKGKATGAAYTGIYVATAENFGGTCGFGCNGEGPPADGCAVMPFFVIQNEGTLIWLSGPGGFSEGTIYHDNSFIVNMTFTEDGGEPSTMEITVTGDFSADEVAGSASMVVEGATSSCDWNFDFSGPITSNVTVTVNGFTEPEFDGVNVYVFVSGVTPDEPPVALGGGELADGSVIIELKPTLADGPNTLGVIVDVDGNIEESISEGDGGPVSVGDWMAGDIPFTISSGSGSVTLNKDDDFGEMN